MEQFGTLLQGLASLAWPIIFALILLGFRDSIKEVLSSAKSRRFTISGQYNAIAGLELTKKIREIDGNVPIIIYTTSRAVRAYRADALRAGANEITASPTVLMNALEFEIR